MKMRPGKAAVERDVVLDLHPKKREGPAMVERGGGQRRQVGGCVLESAVCVE